MQWEAVQAVLSRIVSSVVKAHGLLYGERIAGYRSGNELKDYYSSPSIVAGPDWQQKNGEEWTEASRWIDMGG